LEKGEATMTTGKTVGIMSPGDMGHAVGHLLGSHGLRVITCLQGRSQRTRSLARRAQIEEVSTVQALVSQSDILLSILVPAQAVQLAQVVAKAVSETHADLIYVDCNAIAPQTTCRIGEMITGAGGRFVDVGIIGNPPGRSGSTYFYASGPDTKAFEEMSRFGLSVIVIGEQIGQASAMKMCYAAMRKGVLALFTELLTAAEILGVSRELKKRIQSSPQSILYEQMEQELPRMPEKSRRWIAEMEEIAKTFGDVGLTPHVFAGAAEIYRFVGQTDLAKRTPEDSTPHPSLAEAVKTLAGCLSESKSGKLSEGVLGKKEEKVSPLKRSG
jgi:3-hydroxyisobutyrate dehydrogenase-like beta-hydroxyacid dehydrogenase